ncbi:MAG TPA: gliding motility-associated C-terminal domain-containing protein [Flavobacteriales bacterium]|nr:gliding motility-associated C-terminal domain-containing protein [Flavobacteriales bacterium]
MKKSSLTLVTSFALCFGLATKLQAQSTHTHAHESHEPTPHDHGVVINLTKAYADFDYKAAEKLMDEKGVPASDRAGYLKYLKGLHLKKKYPDFVYTSPEQDVYNNYRPSKAEIENKNKSLMKASIYCVNASFDAMDFSNWVGMYGSYSSVATTGIVTTGINASQFDGGSRHTILTTPPTNNDPGAGAIVGYDEIAISPTSGLAEIPFLAPQGGAVSCRLGNAVNGAQSEKLIYEMDVTPANTQFYYQFAVVLQDPFHSVSDQPYFKISVLDSLGSPVGGVCGIYDVNSTLASSDTSFVQITYLGENLYYRKWEFVGVDLSALVGQSVTIEFQTADCALSGHFGYAYIDTDCGLINLSSSFCSADPFAQIVAPQGFVSYQWEGPNDTTDIPGETDDTLIINSPNIGDTFTVNLESASGCITHLNTVLEFTDISLAFSNMTQSCPDGATGSLTVFPTGSGAGYTFLWSTGDTTATASGLAAGNYSIHIESASGLCGVIDTVLTVTEGPIFATSQTVPFCDLTFTNVVGPTGTNHQWFNMAGTPIITNDTLGVTSPLDGNQFILVYNLPGGCRDSIIYTLDLIPAPSTVTTTDGACGIEFINYSAAGGAPGVTYTVTGLGGSFSFSSGLTTATSQTLTGLLPGTYTASVNDDGCITTDVFTINMVTTTGSSSILPCPGDTVTLNSGVTGNHNYYDPSGNLISTSATATVNGIATGTYVDSVSTGSACQTVYTINVAYDNITATTTAAQNFCWEDQIGAINLTVTHDPPSSVPTFSWTGPDGFTATAEDLTLLETGTYNYTIQSGNCILTGSVYIGGPSQSGDTLFIYTQICQGNPSGVLHAPAGFTNYQWYLNSSPLAGETADSIFITNTEEYEMYTVSYDIPPYGCDRHTSYIINDKPEPLFIPEKVVNVFTPNGDNMNDKFYPFQDQNLTTEQIDIITHDFNMTIFNRWGQVMFTSGAFMDAWDGKFNGKLVDQGVYFWRSTYIPNCADEGESYEYQGTIQVSY